MFSQEQIPQFRPVLRQGLGQLGQREAAGFVALEDGFDDLRGQGGQAEYAAEANRYLGVKHPFPVDSTNN